MCVSLVESQGQTSNKTSAFQNSHVLCLFDVTEIFLINSRKNLAACFLVVKFEKFVANLLDIKSSKSCGWGITWPSWPCNSSWKFSATHGISTKLRGPHERSRDARTKTWTVSSRRTTMDRHDWKSRKATQRNRKRHSDVDDIRNQQQNGTAEFMQTKQKYKNLQKLEKRSLLVLKTGLFCLSTEVFSSRPARMFCS